MGGWIGGMGGRIGGMGGCVCGAGDWWVEIVGGVGEDWCRWGGVPVGGEAL